MCVAGVESSLRVTRCRQILQSLPEHNYAVLSYLIGFLHEVSGQSRAAEGSPLRAGPHRPGSGSLSLGLGTPLSGPSPKAWPGHDSAEEPSGLPGGVNRGRPCPSRIQGLPSVSAHDLLYRLSLLPQHLLHRLSPRGH